MIDGYNSLSFNTEESAKSLFEGLIAQKEIFDYKIKKFEDSENKRKQIEAKKKRRQWYKKNAYKQDQLNIILAQLRIQNLLNKDVK